MTQIWKVCCISGCQKRTKKFAEYSEFICATHWKTVHIATRKAHLAIHRAIKDDPGQALLRQVEAWRAWDACKEAVMEAALREMGVG